MLWYRLTIFTLVTISHLKWDIVVSTSFLQLPEWIYPGEWESPPWSYMPDFKVDPLTKANKSSTCFRKSRPVTDREVTTQFCQNPKWPVPTSRLGVMSNAKTSALARTTIAKWYCSWRSFKGLQESRNPGTPWASCTQPSHDRSLINLYSPTPSQLDAPQCDEWPWVVCLVTPDPCAALFRICWAIKPYEAPHWSSFCQHMPPNDIRKTGCHERNDKVAVCCVMWHCTERFDTLYLQ
jgi:hypothetical protein